AFLWNNRKASAIYAEEELINVQFVQAEAEIESLKVLESQREQMLDKAELAAALVERVPRSILLAEIINRMPPRLSMLMFELNSEEIKVVPSVTAAATGKLNKPGGPTRMKTAEEMRDELTAVQAPKYHVDIVLVGVATTDIEVSTFMHELNNYDLLSTVRLEYSEEQEIEGRTMRQFKIKMSIEDDADVRHSKPTSIKKNMKDPMTDELRFVQPGMQGTPAMPGGEG
ncbi:MAG: PilN domain-containing protein, partial [Planctomycetota bacterium]